MKVLKCPYCGTEMQIILNERATAWVGYGLCPQCFARSPRNRVEIMTKEAAKRETVNMVMFTAGCVEREDCVNAAELGQRDYNAAVEMQQYCERYEPTYNPEDGSM